MIKERLIDLEEKQLKLIKKILKCSIPGKTVWAYGSRVTWKANESSDLDLAVFGCNSRQIFHLKEAFEESDLLISVDVMDWEKIPEKFKTNIKEKYVVLQEQTLEKNKIQIQLSREHGRYIKDVEKCFSGLNVKVESGYVRKSIEELPMQIFIFLAGAVTSGATYDLLKAGIKKALKKFRKAEISIKDKNQNTYNISSKGQVNIFLNSNRKTKMISNIKTIDDLFKHLQAQTGAWQKVKLGEVTNIIGGFAFKSKHFSNSGDSYVVKIKNIKPPYIDIQDAVKVEMSFYKEQDLNKFKIQKGDFVIAMTGATIGKIGKMIAKQETYINQRVAKFEPKNNVNKKFIYYILGQKDFQSFIQNNIDSNSAQENISAKSIGNFPILLPPLHEQKAIAETLSSFDDKIELLHEQNKTLEDTAQTLFRKWFIEDAKDDWEEKSLSDIINFNPEYSLSKGTNAPYLEMKNVSPIHFNPNKWYFRNFTSGMKFKNGDTLLARITPCLENGKTCYVSFLNENEIGWGSTEFIVMRMKSPYHKFISYLLAKDHYFRDFATKNMTGTSGRQRVQATILKNFFIKIPRKEKIQELNLKLDAIQNKLFYNSKQITTLNKLLNTLLPKLMTGKVRLKCLH